MSIKIRQIIVVVALIFVYQFELRPQEYNSDKLENLLEKIAEDTGSSPELDAIEQLAENPLFIKETTVGELLRIPGFTTSEAKDIIHLAKTDSINTYTQIFSNIKLTEDQKYLLMICTTFEEPTEVSAYWRMRNKRYLNDVRGFEEDKFKGDELDLYHRLTAYYEDFSFGILSDRDAGEIVQSDFFSGYAAGELSGWKFILGDYYIESGMGNILWKSFAVRKGAEVIYPAVQMGKGLRPSRSSLDYSHFRGAAVERNYQFSNNKINGLFWYSNTRKSGTVDKTGQYITSFYRAGYYRTETEILKKNSLHEVAFGADINCSINALTAGFTALRLQYDKKIISESKYSFYGKDGNLFALYSYLDLDNSTIGAEASTDANGNLGFKAGSQFNFNQFDLAFSIRSFTPDYRSQFAYNFGESSAPNNEYGFYTGFRYKGIDKFVISSYIDLYASYGRTFYVPEPIKGVDLFCQTDFFIGKTTNIILRLQYENKTDAVKDKNEYQYVIQKGLLRSRLELKQKINKQLNIRLRTEVSYVNFKEVKNAETGIAAFIDLNWTPCQIIKAGFRLSLFSTKSFESVIYQYEWVMPGYMTTTPLYLEGLRYYAWLKIEPVKNLTVWLRYSITKKNNIDNLGSGYLEIDGNKDQRLILQIDFNL
ncbi:hypothetical protein ACFLSQ_11370 [Bacteroidota bacterium]